MRHQHPEAQLQRSVVEHLIRRRKRGWSYWSTPNGARLTSARQGAELKRQGMRPGVGDLSLLSPTGSYYELELKTTTGKLSDAQKARAIEVELCCGTWAVARGIDEALATLTKWGALR